jgi:hypothetical protein
MALGKRRAVEGVGVGRQRGGHRCKGKQKDVRIPFSYYTCYLYVFFAHGDR